MKRRGTIIFRADGHAQMGLGHLYRSAALAAMLQDRFHCILAYLHAPQNTLKGIGRNFSEVTQLKDGEAQTLVQCLEERKASSTSQVVVFDGYHFRTSLQEAIVSRGLKLVCIDDIHDCRFLADVIINHAPINGLMQKYDHADHTALATGLAFSLLRRPFLDVIHEPIDGRITLGEKTGFYICFGGSDAQNVTAKLIGWLGVLGYDEPLDVVLGAANIFKIEVAEASAIYPGEVTIHYNLDDAEMISLYQKTKLAFLPASTTLLEAIASGVPVVTGHYVDNQVDIYEGFMAKGFLAGVGDWNKPDNLNDAIQSALSVRRIDYQLIARQYLDGYSNVNLSLVFEQLLEGVEPLVCRPAEPEDIQQYFEWVNTASVRENAINQDLIKWGNHESWFSSRLRDPESLLFYFTYRNKPCGQLRFELSDGYALIDISVDEKYRGQGIASRMLRIGQQQLLQRYLTPIKMLAFVLPDNLASTNLFKRSQFTFMGRSVSKGVELLRYEKNVT